MNSPKQLLYNLDYRVFGLHFRLRACKEYRQLRAEIILQLKIIIDPIWESNILRYTEDCEKKREMLIYMTETFLQIIDVYEVDNERNIVKTYKKHMSVRSDGENSQNYICNRFMNRRVTFGLRIRPWVRIQWMILSKQCLQMRMRRDTSRIIH